MNPIWNIDKVSKGNDKVFLQRIRFFYKDPADVSTNSDFQMNVILKLNSTF
ncbi:hypothetical protein HNR39_002130 [Glaciimonas immobilis]|uniref:Uncharacterized protein n=1 Tax=Glaciimonas immobilis TaxID=728004 RepID=A0A840RRA1_9BURK|nr:hypothetical protein [Glaciimonas immobilis]